MLEQLWTNEKKIDEILLGKPATKWEAFKRGVRLARDWVRGYRIPSVNAYPSPATAEMLMYMGRIVPWARGMGMSDESAGRATFWVDLGPSYRWLPWRRRAAEGLLMGFLQGAAAVGVVITLEFRHRPHRRERKPVETHNPWDIQ